MIFLWIHTSMILQFQSDPDSYLLEETLPFSSNHLERMCFHDQYQTVHMIPPKKYSIMFICECMPRETEKLCTFFFSCIFIGDICLATPGILSFILKGRNRSFFIRFSLCSTQSCLSKDFSKHHISSNFIRNKLHDLCPPPLPHNQPIKK